MTQPELGSGPLNAIPRPEEAVTEAVQVARVLWLRSLFGTPGDSDEHRMDELASRMTEFFIPRGTALYEAGTETDALFFIFDGEIRQGEKGYTRYVSGDVLGFLDAMAGRPHAMTAMVQEDAIVLRLKVQDWLEYLEDNFEALRGLVLTTSSSTGLHADRIPEEAQRALSTNAEYEHNEASSLFVRQLLAARHSRLLGRGSIQALAQLVRQSRLLHLEAGVSLEAKARNPGICLVVCGVAKLRPHSSVPSEPPLPDFEYGPGQLVGSLLSLTTIPEDYRLHAETELELLHLDQEHFFDIMEDHFDLARSVLSYIAWRLEENAADSADEGTL